MTSLLKQPFLKSPESSAMLLYQLNVYARGRKESLADRELALNLGVAVQLCSSIDFLRDLGHVKCLCVSVPHLYDGDGHTSLCHRVL